LRSKPTGSAPTLGDAFGQQPAETRMIIVTGTLQARADTIDELRRLSRSFLKYTHVFD